MKGGILCPNVSINLNGNTANFFLVILAGMFGLLWRQNSTLERVQGYVHENHAITKRIEMLGKNTNGRVGEVELRQSWQQGALAAIGGIMTLGVAIASVVLIVVL